MDGPIQSLGDVEAFTTKDGSTIRELHHTSAQSLAEATLPPGASTQRHYHALTEEIYFVLDGEGEMELDGQWRHIVPGDAVLIAPGVWHSTTATTEMRFLCCCAPPYSHDDTYFE